METDLKLELRISTEQVLNMQEKIKQWVLERSSSTIGKLDILGLFQRQMKRLWQSDKSLVGVLCACLHTCVCELSMST